MIIPSTPREINHTIVNALLHGPTRVLISAAGKAWPARRAQRAGFRWDLLLIRNDGWSLGCKAELYSVAHALWADCWTHAYDLRTDLLYPLADPPPW